MSTTSTSLKKRTYLCALLGAGMAWLSVGQASVPPRTLVVTPSNTLDMSASDSWSASSIRLLAPSSVPPPVVTQSDATKAAEDGNDITAMQESPTRHPVDDNWVAVNEADLDNMRGGFDIEDVGLKVSVGIQRAVYINGNLSTTTGFNIPNVGKLTNGQTRLSNPTTSTINLVQNGPGNTFQPGPMPQVTTATVIQNTLDNQNVQSLTTINATANSLGMLKGINFQSSLQDALQNAVGSR